MFKFKLVIKMAKALQQVLDAISSDNTLHSILFHLSLHVLGTFSMQGTYTL